jgi:hypothetical protein
MSALLRFRTLAGVGLLVLAVLCPLLIMGSRAGAAGDADCTASYGGAAPRSGPPLRFGIDPGLAGSVGGAQLPTVPDDVSRDVAAVHALDPSGRVLVARLNRLFWSGGEAAISQFKALVSRYTQAGVDVELQVRYHPTSAENGDLAAWEAYVRHVVDVFGPDPRVVSMTITNEVNVTFSPNTSDGSYKNAKDALIDGIEAGHQEAAKRGYRQLRFGFTYAYRFSPPGDAAFFSYLGQHGGSAFRQALGFVGLDFYPGSVYPPTMAPGDTYRAETAQALGTVRDCFMPQADLGRSVPIWITEDGVPTGANSSEAAQASDLAQLVDSVQAYSGTFGVTDYRWFNLRDSNSSSTGSLPGAAATFATDGLLRADYSRKPSFAAFRAAIARLGRHLAPAKTGGSARCRRARLTLKLVRQRRAIRRVTVYLGRRRLGQARGRRLRRVMIRNPRRAAFRLRVVLRLRGGRRVVYRRRYRLRGCRIVRPAHVTPGGSRKRKG